MMGAHPAENDVLERVLAELARLREDNASLHEENQHLAAQVREENQTLAARVDALDRQSPGHHAQRMASKADQPNTGDGDASDTIPGLSRRRLLTRLAGAGAVGAGLLAVGDTFGPRAAQAAAGGNMILGDANDAGTALTGLTSSNNGATLDLQATGTTSGFDPLALQCLSTGTGVVASGEIYGVIAAATLAGSAPLLLAPATAAGPPTNGAHQVGEVFVDGNGALFQCVARGTPGTWVRVGFNPLNPTRILDTRTTSPIGANSSINLTVGGSFGVPTQASAIVVNATVTQGTAQSFLTIYPEGTTRPLASNLNWVAGQTIPNLVTVKLGTGGGITIYNAAGSVDVVLDLAGFYS
jgi:hypothetical protein